MITIVKPDGTSVLLDSTLDVVQTIAGEAPLGQNPTLYVVGCRGSSQIVVTFTDQDSDGLADEKAGEFALPSGIGIVRMVPHLASSELFAIDLIGDRIIRLADTNSDSVPDTVADYITRSSSQLVDPLADLIVEPGNKLLVLAASAPPLDAEITVAEDADGNGTPEVVARQLYGSYIQPDPNFRNDPRAADTADVISGTPGSSIEVWRTDSSGAKLSQDVNVDRIASGSIPTTATEATLARSLTLSVGEYVRAFDVTVGSEGGTVQVRASYPIADSVSPAQISRSIGGTLTISGSGFDGTTAVTLRSMTNGSLAQALAPTIVSSTSLTVTIPTLPAPWGGSAQLWVTNSSSPPSGSVVTLAISLPPP